MQLHPCVICDDILIAIVDEHILDEDLMPVLGEPTQMFWQLLQEKGFAILKPGSVWHSQYGDLPILTKEFSDYMGDALAPFIAVLVNGKSIRPLIGTIIGKYSADGALESIRKYVRFRAGENVFPREPETSKHFYNETAYGMMSNTTPYFKNFRFIVEQLLDAAGKDTLF